MQIYMREAFTIDLKLWEILFQQLVRRICTDQCAHEITKNQMWVMKAGHGVGSPVCLSEQYQKTYKITV